jgi:tyrosine-protein kinase Etk/Wzc
MQEPLKNEQIVEDIHLKDYLRIILRRRKIFLLAFLAVVMGVSAYTFTMKPIYEASATLHIRDDKGRGKGSLADELGISSQNPVDTEIEILKSATNAEQVVKNLHLDWEITDRSKGILFTLLEFEVPETGNQPYAVTLVGPGRYILADSGGTQVAEGRDNVPLSKGPFHLLLTGIKGNTGDSFKISKTPIDIATGSLQKQIKAMEVGKKTSIIRLTVNNTSPVRAKEITNNLAQVYLEQSIGFKTQEASKTVEFIETQLKNLQGAVNAAETDLSSYKSATGMVKLDISAEQVVKKLADLDTERATLSLQKKQVEFARASLKEAMARGLVYTPSILREDAAVSALAGRLNDLEIQKRALRSEQTDDNPRIRALQAQIAETHAKLRETYDANLKTIDKSLSGQDTLMQRYEGEIRKLPSAELELARLTRVSKVNVDIYLFLLQKHEEARIAKAATISSINVIDPAKLPRKPVKPDKMKNVVLALLVGLMLGGGLAFFTEYLDDTIKDGEEARRLLGLPIMATIPFITGDKSDQQEYAPSLISHLNPKASVTESFRSLRTSIHFSAISKEKKVILVTSNFPSEGKTTVIANLAVTMTQTGAKVLLIDCDMRRPSQHTLFKQEKIPGLSEILAGDTSIAAVLHDTGIPGLSFIPAGTTPPNPAELIGSQEMQKLLASLKLEYDYILIDAPPYLAVTDAPLLSSSADIMILVLQTERVPGKLAKQTVDMLHAIGAPIAGIVINDKTGQTERYGYYGGKYYGYYGYGYGYGNAYYGEEKQTSKKNTAWWKKIFR